MKHNIYISLHTCSATVRLLHSCAQRLRQVTCQVVVVIHERPGRKRLSQKRDIICWRYTTNDVTCTVLAIFPAGTISFGHAAGGFTMLVGMEQVTTQPQRPSDMVTLGHVMRMDILWHLMLTALAYCEDTMAS